MMSSHIRTFRRVDYLRISITSLAMICLVVHTGCASKKSPDFFEYSTAHIGSTSLASLFLNPGSAPADTIHVASFPVRHIEHHGETYTLMTVGQARYDPGKPGGSVGQGRTAMSLPNVPPSWRVMLEDTQMQFLIPARLPLNEKRYWFFWNRFAPELFFFSAVFPGNRLEIDGQIVHILEPVIASKQRVVSRSTSQVHSVNVPLRFHRPTVPQHLLGVWQPPYMIVHQRYYFKNEDYVRSLIGTRLEIDLAATERLMRSIVERPNEYLFDMDASQANRIIRWIGAQYLILEAEEFRTGRRKPVYLGIDRPGLMELKCHNRARSLLDEAVKVDPGSEDLRNQLLELEMEVETLHRTITEQSPSNRWRLSTTVEWLKSRGDNQTNEIEPRNFLILGPELSYQATNAVAATFAWHLFQTFDPTLPGQEASNTRADVFGFRFDYQPPIRLQLNQLGLRPQVGIGWRRLAVSTDYQGYNLSSTGSAYEIGIGLITRKVSIFSGVNWGVSLTANWRWGSYGDFQSDEGITLIHNPSQLPVKLNADGFSIRFGFGFGY